MVCNQLFNYKVIILGHFMVNFALFFQKRYDGDEELEVGKQELGKK